MGVSQANEFPGLAGVDRFIHSVSADDVSPNASFAGTYIDDVGVGFGNGQRANRGRGVLLLVEERLPIEPAIGGLPNAAGHTAEIINVVLADDTGHGKNPSAAKRPDETIVERLPRALVFLIIFRRCGCSRRLLRILLLLFLSAFARFLLLLFLSKCRDGHHSENRQQ